MNELIKIEVYIRESISEEQKAVADYKHRIGKLTKMIDDVDDATASKIRKFITILEDIVEEEQLHIGQFTKTLELFDVSRQKEFEGEQEAEKQITESFVNVANKFKRMY